MLLKALYLKNFRNYEDAVISFSPKLNCIFGGNGEGKSSLLEALSLLMTGRSFRTRHLDELIHFGTHFFHIELHFEKNGIDQRIQLTFDGEKRSIIFNHTPLPSLSALLGTIPGVLLSPEDRELIKGEPAARRQFLDLQISQTNPLYLHHLSRYLRAMKYRNILLRQKNISTIEIWEEKMAQSAAYMIPERAKAVEEIACGKEIKLVYKSTLSGTEKEIHELYLKYLSKHRPREMEWGYTSEGPHRDNLEIFYQDKEARLFASEGEQRTCVIALRFAEWERLKRVTEEIPIMCIDDVAICLDPTREKKLYERLATLGQVFLTSPRFDWTLLPPESHLIEVKNGSLKIVESDEPHKIAFVRDTDQIQSKIG